LPQHKNGKITDITKIGLRMKIILIKFHEAAIEMEAIVRI